MIGLRTAVVAVLRKLLVLPLCFANMQAETPAPLPEAPQVSGQKHIVSLSLRAIRDSKGTHAFEYRGQTVAPVIRVEPGDLLKITYTNNLPSKSDEDCALGPCMNMSNLHFHGLQVSPKAPADDVITMLAMPGETLHYVVRIPKNHPPGLFWYHPHPHGESQRQVLDGMSGAIVVEGMERYVPEVRRLRERILVLRGPSIEHDPNAATLRQRVGASPTNCGGEPEEAERIFTINGAVRPQIDIAPGERQFWRMVNASPDRYLDVQLDGQPLEVVAMDGMPLALHDPRHPTQLAGHVLLPPAGRLEAIVTGPPVGVQRTLRTLCVNTGTAGDPSPEMVLADLVPGQSRAVAAAPVRVIAQPRVPREIGLKAKQKSAPDFIVTFTEDKNGFYINGQKYAPDAKPMVRARVGTYQHWRIVNQSDELHPFHIHQVHFLAYVVNGVQLANAEWLDTVNVPTRGTVDVIMDFTNPVIRGMSLFHCHLLNHEDKGMMAKIAFE